MTATDASTGVGEQVEIHSLQERYKNGSLETVSQDEYKPLEFDPDSGYALVLTRKFNKDNRVESTTLKINSKNLLQIFREVIQAHSAVPEGFDEPFEIKSPYAMLYHHWDNLHDYRKTLTDKVDLAHLDLLLEFMRLEMGKQRVDIQRTVQNGSISFSQLWAIFKPGDLLFKTEKEHPCLLKLEKTLYEESKKQGRRFEVHCTRTFNDGTGLYRRAETFTIFERCDFGGGTSAKIVSLPIYPFVLSQQAPAIRNALIDRGTRVQQYVGVKTMAYKGLADYQKLPPRSWFDPQMEDYETVWLAFFETGRVVIDVKTYLEDYPVEAKRLSRSWPQEYRDWAEAQFGSLDRANKALCVPYVQGYSLKKKKWCKLYIENLEEIAWDVAAIKSLVIPDTQKSVLEALVTSHRFTENPRELQGQKGKGLVMLLHGTPGSGKTLTAEVTAELCKAPLLSISLGELYEYENFDEDRLQELLQYATMWRGIVLIDEADVFLEARAAGAQNSAQRNALVATFLRSLEYFAGIVFLTSNRVEDFDTAMKSRIHLAIQYSPPPTEVRRQIWVKRLASVSVELGFNVEDGLATLTGENMNGREIANTINTALTLARHQDTKLGMTHLETVIEAWREFNASLSKLKNKPRRKSFGTMIRSDAMSAVDNEPSMRVAVE